MHATTKSVQLATRKKPSREKSTFTAVQLCANCAQALSIAAGRTLAPVKIERKGGEIMNTEPFSLSTQYVAAGLSTIPIKADESKAPPFSWREYQDRLPSAFELKKWFGNGAARGIAIIGGRVSGNLEILDFDDPALIPTWRDLIEEEAPGLLARLPQVETPSGGLHIYFRCENIQGNQKLAEREIEVSAETPGAHRRDGKFFKIKTLIETRGEGGYVVAPGSPLECHALKKPYILINGALSATPTITAEEREILFACARRLNEFIKPSDQIAPEKSRKSEAKKPGEDFNARGDVRALLEKHGWKYLKRDSAGELWARPGVAHTSASLFENNYFYIFSTNAYPLESGRAYSPFALFATLEHGGDFSAAARGLAAEGYGEPKGKKDDVESEDDSAERNSDRLAQRYKVNDRGIVWEKWVKEGGGGGAFVPIQLTNFIAKITSDISRDDGTEQVRQYEISASMPGLNEWRKGAVNAEEFGSMRWPDELLGARAVVFPSHKERASVAIRLLSDDIAMRRVVAHTGWRNDDDVWCYYHAGGAIGSDGLIEAEVSLPAALSPCILPAPPTGDELKDAFLAVLKLWDVAPLEVMIPLIGAPLNSVLGDTDYAQHLSGHTGTGKTQLAAIVQSFFGQGFDAQRLPGSWSSTGNSLEALAHAAKDCVIVVDDFCPTGSAADQARFHRDADRLIRAQGNHSGRMRCRVDGSVRAAKPPRGLIISTGEDVPRGQSLRARMIVIELERGAISWSELTKAQALARNDVYALALSAFIQWLAKDGKIADLQKKAATEISNLRAEWLKDSALNESHKRAVSALAQIARAWRIWLHAACDLGVMQRAEAEDFWQKIWATLRKVGARQAIYQAGEDPSSRFIELIQAALSSGRAHLAAPDGDRPDEPETWGWRERETQNGKEWAPHGDRIGWIDGSDVYLQPDAAFAMAQRTASGGEGLTVTSQTLWKRLREAGHLASIDTARDTQKIRRKVEGKAQGVIHFLAEKFTGALI